MFLSYSPRVPWTLEFRIFIAYSLLNNNWIYNWWKEAYILYINQFSICYKKLTGVLLFFCCLRGFANFSWFVQSQETQTQMLNREGQTPKKVLNIFRILMRQNLDASPRRDMNKQSQQVLKLARSWLFKLIFNYWIF